MRDGSGSIVSNSLITAHDIWSAFGETQTSFARSVDSQLKHRVLCRQQYDAAAKYAYKNSAAGVKDDQYDAIVHAMSRSISNHSFAFLGCGRGKSGIYVLPLLAHVLHGVKPPKIVVISPHNALLTQHRLQAEKYFRGTSLRVMSALPTNIRSLDTIPSEFDLLFISIHAFKDLLDNFSHVVDSWNISNIFIDEYHNIFGEIFRHETSWVALNDLARLKAKIMCMSATANAQLMEYVGSYLGMGDYKVIGSAQTYPMPDVTINVEKYDNSNVIANVIQRVEELTSKKQYKFKIHIVTMTREDAEDIWKQLCNRGVSSIWLTSQQIQKEKENIMRTWEEQDDQVIVTTFTDGIDNSLIEDVIVVRARYSVTSLIQALGRIRPCKQQRDRATLHIFDTGYDPTTNIEDNDTWNYIAAAHLIPNDTGL